MNSTFVRPDYKGKGIAGLLLAEIVKQAREKGVKIVPECSYVEHTFEIVKQAREKGVKIVPECSYVEHTFEKREEYADVWAK